MYSHSKRMLPRKDEPFRTEFPSHYYSSSSVYSYTPTSSSDCPEHGRSHRRTTLILTVSVIFATLGVLSIAGVAAYLGIHSKGNNNASQIEESYMLLNSNSKILSDEDNDREIYYGNGRSSHRDPIGDLGNSLLETRPDNPAVPSFEDIEIDSDLNQKHHNTKPPTLPPTKVRFSQQNSTSVVTSKVKVNTHSNFDESNLRLNNYNHETGIGGPIVVKTSTSTSAVVSSQQSQSTKNHQQDGTRYSSGSPPPSTHHRYPPTNSHYGHHDVVDTKEQQSHFLTHFDSDSSIQRNPVVTTSGMISFHDFHNQNKSSPNVHEKSITPNVTSESKVTRKEEHRPSSHNQQDYDFALLDQNGQGLSGNYENVKKLTTTNSNKQYNLSAVSSKNPIINYKNDSQRWPSTTSVPPTYYQFSSDKSKHATPTPVPFAVHIEQSGTGNNRDHFVPVKPFFKTRTPTISPEGTPTLTPNDSLANHKIPLEFDRIAPEFYDQNPWTPLVVRPNVDKKPRIENVEPISDITPELVVPAHAQSKEMYYRTGDTTSNVNVNIDEPLTASHGQGNSNAGNNIQSSSDRHKGEDDNNGPLRHALESDHQSHSHIAVINSTDNDVENKGPNLNMSIIVSTSTNVEDEFNSPPSLSPSASSPNSSAQNGDGEKQEEPWDDVVQRPLPIPAYTVLIPHIPNPKTRPEDTENVNNVVLNNEFDAEKFRNGDIGQFLSGIESAAEESPTEHVSAERSEHEKMNNIVDKHKEVEQIGESVHSEVKDEEYADTDTDDIHVETSPQTNIYRLDSVDLDYSQGDEPDKPVESNIKNKVEQVKNITASASSEESIIKGPIEPDLQIRTTTDFILSTLGSLNLVKPLPTRSNGEGGNTEQPLFPPIRSYVGINQPLRPKPSESDESGESKIILLSEPNFIMHGDPHRKLRTEDGNEIPHLSPDLTTTSSFNKVLSMMMKFDTDTNRTAGNPLANITSQNIHLVVAHSNYSAPIAAYLNDTQNREQKSIHRDAKIDSRFRDYTEQIPVTLISAGSTVGAQSSFRPSKSNATGKWNPNKLSSVTVQNSNSPVYKFVLRKGQSVEELLKEIFHNYTNKGIGNSTGLLKSGLPPSANIITTRPEVPGSSPGSVDIQFTTLTTTTKLPFPSSTPTAVTSTTFLPTTTSEGLSDAEINTSTSITLNENENEDCSTNSSFRCISTGNCISSFARCNGIRDCSDNSDEKECLCVDFLKSQLLHRKICDGIVDCLDKSDEDQCEWCTPGQYICAGSRACIPRDKICDGSRDCPRGDDEGDCVKIGYSGEVDELEDLSPTYHRSGHLMVRKKGVWGKLCVETFSTVLSHWEVKDLARAVCKAKTFSDFETVERVEDEDFSTTEPYYELYDGNNQNDSAEASYPSSESAPRSSIGFKLSACKTKVVVKVTCQDLQCGTAPRAFTQAARIVGGSNALAGEWPWQAALYRDGEYQCGATLISSRWLLSAGHCFYHSQDDHWVARLGTLRRGATILSPYEQVIRITHIFLHPQYKDTGFVNDVSLLRLEKEVNFTDFVRPVCLPSRDTQVKDGRMCTVVGWGQLFEVGRVFPDTLQEVQLPLISTAECRKRTLFLPLYKLTDEMFCAGFDRGGRDACLGDSGGPLMCPESDGRWSLYGVTSNGYGCARANRPGVYTKVASYLDWIYDKMSKHDSVTYRDKAKPCRGHRCPLGECLEQKRLCNGVSECLDGSDERNCTWS